MMARGVHLIDLARYLSGREVEEITAMTDSQRPDHSMDDTVLATLRLGDDVFATLFATRRAAEAKNGYSVYGTAGRLEATDSFIYGTGELALTLGGVESETGYRGPSPYQEEIAAFNRAVLEGIPFEASGQDGLMVVRATVALLESAQTGRAVKP